MKTLLLLLQILLTGWALDSTAFSQTMIARFDAAKDNTLFENPTGAFSNGAGEYLFAGRTARTISGGEIRRGLIAFSLSDRLPVGSTILSASLTLYLSQANENSGDQPISLHRALSDWGAGESDSTSIGGGGSGALAEPGDATWLHTFSDIDLWNRPGGDFFPTDSATSTIGTDAGAFHWSSPGMTNDVQEWVDRPTENFGWLLLGHEADRLTARRFNSSSHSNPATRPELRIEYL
ncbi:MAG: DNRLRE domain-containing protein, partial [Verrucomicrobiota bacterium]